MSRTLPVLTAVVVTLALIALAACGDDGGEEVTQTPATPATATATETPTGTTGATPTPAVALTPEGTEFSSSATASAKVGDKTLTFENGTCARGPDDAWLGVSIGQVDTNEYFVLLVGNPGGLEGVRSAKGGGEFTDGEIVVVTGSQGGTTFVMHLSEQDKVTVAVDLRSGEFVGTTAAGEPLSGSFAC